MDPITEKLKILIVEDDPAQAMPLEKILLARVVSRLKDDNIEVSIVIVGTLEAALVEAPTANVTILDLGLPDSDPVITIMAISKFRPPVIVMTGHDDPDLWACIARGADHVFVKGQIHGLCSQLLDSMMKDVLIANGMLSHASQATS